jgi:hypothetical protein
MIIFYRYSDKGKSPIDFNYKINKVDCWNNFKRHFKNQKIIIICDNCKKQSINFFKNNGYEVIETYLGNSQSALYTYKYAIENFPNEKYYFCEDDYIHDGEDLTNLLEECLEYTDYCSLYDHGDKYKNFNANPNPLLKSLGEHTELFRTKNSHWKLTNSTTMTFATKFDVLKNDIEIIKDHCIMNIPNDLQMFLDLLRKGRTLATPIPSKSTHLSPDKDNLAPFFKINE